MTVMEVGFSEPLDVFLMDKEEWVAVILFLSVFFLLPFFLLNW